MGRLHLSDGLLRTSGGRLVLTDSQGGAPCCGCGGSSEGCTPGEFPDAVYLNVANFGPCENSGRHDSPIQVGGGPDFSTEWRTQVLGTAGGFGSIRLDRTTISPDGLRAGYSYFGNVPEAGPGIARIRINTGQAIQTGGTRAQLTENDLEETEWRFGQSLTLACLAVPVPGGGGETVNRLAVVADGGSDTGTDPAFGQFATIARTSVLSETGVDLTAGDGLTPTEAAQSLAPLGPGFSGLLMLVGVQYPHSGLGLVRTEGNGPDILDCTNGATIDCGTDLRINTLPIGQNQQVLSGRPPCIASDGGGTTVNSGSRYWDAASASLVGGVDWEEIWFATQDSSCDCSPAGVLLAQPHYSSRVFSHGGVSVTIAPTNPDETPPESGGCCLPDINSPTVGMIERGCNEVDPETCDFLLGEYAGDDVLCTEADCGPIEPTGACCDGTDCTQATEFDCATQGGAYQGDGVPCSPNPCSPAVGACCGFDGTCTETTQADCFAGNGEYQGDGTLCADTFCRSTGACCAPAVGTNPARCIDFLTNEQCDFLRGVYFGNGSLCGSRDCSDGASIPADDPTFIDDEQQALSAGSFF